MLFKAGGVEDLAYLPFVCMDRICVDGRCILLRLSSQFESMSSIRGLRGRKLGLLGVLCYLGNL